MVFKKDTAFQEVLKTADLSKLSKDKFTPLLKDTICELLVHFIQESDKSHDKLVSKINSRVSVVFDSKLTTISQMYDAKIKQLEAKFESEMQNLIANIPTSTAPADPDVTASEETTTKYSLLVTQPPDTSEPKSWATIVSDIQ